MIGKILKQMRREKELSQEDMAMILNINQTTLSGYERGYREPNYETIEKIAKICNYEIQFINKNTNNILTTKNIERKEI